MHAEVREEVTLGRSDGVYHSLRGRPGQSLRKVNLFISLKSSAKLSSCTNK